MTKRKARNKLTQLARTKLGREIERKHRLGAAPLSFVGLVQYAVAMSRARYPWVVFHALARIACDARIPASTVARAAVLARRYTGVKNLSELCPIT